MTIVSFFSDKWLLVRLCELCRAESIDATTIAVPDYFMDTTTVDAIRKVIVPDQDNTGLLRLAAKTQTYEFPEDNGVLSKKKTAKPPATRRQNMVIVFDQNKVVSRTCSLPRVPCVNFVNCILVLQKCLIYRPKEAVNKEGAKKSDGVKTVYMPYVEMAALDILSLESGQTVQDVLMTFLHMNQVHDAYSKYMGEDVRMPNNLRESGLVKAEIDEEIAAVEGRSATYMSTKKGTGEAFDLCDILGRSRLKEVEATFSGPINDNHISAGKAMGTYTVYYNVRDRMFELPLEYLALMRLDKSSLVKETKPLLDRLNGQVGLLLNARAAAGESVTLRSCLESVHEKDKDFFLTVTRSLDILLHRARADGNRFEAEEDLSTSYGQLCRVYRTCAVLTEMFENNALGPLTTAVTRLLGEGGLWSSLPAADLDPYTSTPQNTGAITSSAAMKGLHTLLTKAPPVTICSLSAVFLPDVSAQKTASALKYYYAQDTFRLIGYDDKKLLHSYTLTPTGSGKGHVMDTSQEFFTINNVMKQPLTVDSFAALENLVNQSGRSDMYAEIVRMVFRTVVTKSDPTKPETAAFYFKTWFDPQRGFLKTVTTLSFDVVDVVYKRPDAAYVENALGRSIGRAFKEVFSLGTWMAGQTPGMVGTRDLMKATFPKTRLISAHDLEQKEVMTASDAEKMLATQSNNSGLLGPSSVGKLEVNASKDVYYVNGEPAMYVVHKSVEDSRAAEMAVTTKTMLRNMIRRHLVASGKVDLKIGFSVRCTSTRKDAEGGGAKGKGATPSSVADPRCVMYDKRTKMEKVTPLGYLDTTHVTATGLPPSSVIGGGELAYILSDTRNLHTAMKVYESTTGQDSDTVTGVLRDFYRAMAHMSPEEKDGTWRTGPLAESLLVYAGPCVDTIPQTQCVMVDTTARPDSLLDFSTTS